MHGHDVAVLVLMLFAPAFLGSLREAGIGGLRVTRTRERRRK